MKKFVIISIIIVTFGIAGCGGGGGSTTTGDANFDNTGGSFNTDKSSLVVGGTDNNVMVMNANTVTFTTSDGNSVVMYYANGYPTKVIVGNDTDGYNVIVFGNWDTTNSTVDIGFVKSDGSIVYERNVAVDTSVLLRLAELNASISTVQYVNGVKIFDFDLPDLTVAEAWDFGSHLFSAGVCGAAIGTAAASAGIGVPGVALACSSYVLDLSVMTGLVGEDSTAANASGAVLTTVDAIGCAGGNAVDCAGVAVTAGGLVIDTFSAGTEDIEDETRLAEGAVSSGFGDIKITLTWDNGSDLDLHVIDPNGFEIYYPAANRQSPSGGELDVDDTNGYGPENIFWPDNGAPDGTYQWWVHYFTSNGAGTANWTVQLLVGDESKICMGSLGSGQTTTMAFTYPGGTLTCP